MASSQTFKSIGVISRPRRANLSAVLPELFQRLKARGLRVFYDQETASALPGATSGLPREQVAEKSDLLIVLGGDGTLLAAARVAAPRGIPILPVNMGSLGFLTSFTVEELYPALEETLAGRSSVSERVMLQVELFRDSNVLDQRHVLNDAVINKGALARMIELELSIDGDFVCRYRADGLVVATPTGSTAYSLSAGGPIVHPSVEAFIITPICPHTLTDRPVVVRDFTHVEIKLTSNSEDVYLTLDGQKGIPVQENDRICIARSTQRLKLIQPPQKSYFEILRNKLKWGEV
ncbi:MAG TPA: NAD(+)/NADH kinase [Candidatus Methylomirabilis sp.]|nr:NAD(+)/NADH kinase [Candidatus Methylomirabilis sp.]